MYLILDIEAAEARNKQEAEKRGCLPPTCYWWAHEDNETQCALNVGDGDGLTKAELNKCIDELPDDFHNEGEG